MFFDFIECETNTVFVAIHELGAVKFEFTGAKRWSISTDILENWLKVPGDKLILHQQNDGKEIVVDMESGKPLA